MRHPTAPFVRCALVAALLAATAPSAAQTVASEPSLDATQPVRPHDFVDTRLTWTFGDDDVIGPGVDRTLVSPLPSIGDRPQYRLFFDALNSRYAGRENLTHLALYARAPGFIPRVQTEAMLLVRLDLTALAAGAPSVGQSFYDAGSYLRVQYQTNLARPSDGLSLTLFPFDTDRFRVGYLWELSWGGNHAFPTRVGPAPGVRLGFDSGPFSAYLGAKTAAVVLPTMRASDGTFFGPRETQYGALGGVGLRLGDLARVDLSGGWFQQGRLDGVGAPGRQRYLVGGSARVVINRNLAPATSVDMLLYRNDPNFPFQAFAQEVYVPGMVAWLASAEASVGVQRLADFDQPGATRLQPGLAGAVQGRFKYGYLGVGATALYRDVRFLLQSPVAGSSDVSVPNGADARPETFVAAQVDYRIAGANLLPSLVAGVQLPAMYTLDLAPGTPTPRRTLIYRRAGDAALLDATANDRKPIYSVRLATRWDLSPIFAALAWVQYVHDANAVVAQSNVAGTAIETRAYSSPHQFGFGLTAQARF